MLDIYFSQKYGELYESIENGKCEKYIYENHDGEIQILFIKKPLKKVKGIQYYEITTPYGYGGPIVTRCEGNRISLINSFEKHFNEYCLENRIVSEFVRFHPILENHKDFKDIYEIEFRRKTVGTAVSKYSDPITTEFSKSVRKCIKKGLEIGLSVQIVEKPNDLFSFKNVYYETMKRNSANEIYYFSNEYFEKCLQNLKDNIILAEVYYEGNVIASGLHFKSGKFVHAHLSGTLTEYLNLNPAYLIKYAIVEWAKNQDVDYVHYGGGVTASDDDTLFKFKKKFGKTTDFEYWVGNKFYNKEIYFGEIN